MLLATPLISADDEAKPLMMKIEFGRRKEI